MSGLDNLPKSKWTDVGEQPILKSDFEDIEAAILQIAGKGSAVPTIYYNDTTSVRLPATPDGPVGVSLSGFPNVLHPGLFVTGGLTDGKYRENTGNSDIDFDTGPTFWGVEKVSQWYGVFAIAGDADATFTIKAMPWLRVSSIDAGTNVITLRNNLNTANRGYGFSTNGLVGYKIYFVSGASKGKILEITANDNTNSESTGGTITYTGTDPTVSQGDWFIILPDTNFRWIGDFYNNASGNIEEFYKNGSRVDYDNIVEGSADAYVFDATRVHVPPLAKFGGFSLYNSTDLAYQCGLYPNIEYTYPYYPETTADAINGTIFIKDGNVYSRYVDGDNGDNYKVRCHYFLYAEGVF